MVFYLTLHAGQDKNHDHFSIDGINDEVLSAKKESSFFLCLNGHGPAAWCYNAPYASMNKISFIKASLAGKVCY